MKHIISTVCILPMLSASVLGSNISSRIERRIELEHLKEMKRDMELAEFNLAVATNCASAMTGDIEAQFWMARYCRAYARALPDKMIDQKYKYAVDSLRWLTKAADAGHMNAMYSLGVMLIDGCERPRGNLDSYQLGLDVYSLLSQSRQLRFGNSKTKQGNEEAKPIVLKPSQMSSSTFAPDFVYKRDVEVTTNEMGLVSHSAKSTTYRRLYKQDIVRGLAYLKKSAELGHDRAKEWFAVRTKYGLPEDLPTLACATNSFSIPAVGQVFKLTVKTREFGDGCPDSGFYRTIAIDSTGKTVGISAEFCSDPYDGSWHKLKKNIVIEE